MSTSEWIQLGTLVVVLAYTLVTCGLLWQQKTQFNRSLRPWIMVGDILYNERIVLPELGVVLYNVGRMPANCTVLVDRLEITPEFGDRVSVINRDKVQDFIIFPNVEGTDSLHMFLFNLTEQHSMLIRERSRIECHIKIEYKTIDDRNTEGQYLYEAGLLVEHFTEKASKQTTAISVSSAK